MWLKLWGILIYLHPLLGEQGGICKTDSEKPCIEFSYANSTYEKGVCKVDPLDPDFRSWCRTKISSQDNKYDKTDWDYCNNENCHTDLHVPSKECQAPEGYSRQSDGFHYLVSHEKMVFQEAQDFCRQHDGNLLITFGQKQIDLLKNETIVSNDVWLHPASNQYHNPPFSQNYDQRAWYSVEKKRIKISNKNNQDEQIQMRRALCQSICLYELPEGSGLIGSWSPWSPCRFYDDPSSGQVEWMQTRSRHCRSPWLPEALDATNCREATQYQTHCNLDPLPVLLISGRPDPDFGLVVDLSNPLVNCEAPFSFPESYATNGVGGVVSNVPIICGGYNSESLALKSCYILYMDGVVESDMSVARKSAAAIVVDDGKTLWVTGGWDGDSFFKTTEFVSLDGITDGPDLPMAMSSHCLVPIDSSTSFLFHQGKSWYYSHKDSIWTQGKHFIVNDRMFADCGIILDFYDGQELFVVTGGRARGRSVKSTEILDLETLQIQLGPPLPEEMTLASSMTTPDRKQFLMIDHKIIYSMRCHSRLCFWNLLQQEENYLRPYGFVIPIPDELADCKIIREWSSWSAFGDCQEFNEGFWIRERTRNCPNPYPAYEVICDPDPYTNLTDTDWEVCIPVDGDWTDWEVANDTECVEETGSGNWTKPKWRNCSNPEPMYGGNLCPLSGQDSTSTDLVLLDIFEEIYIICEPIDGNWSEWTVSNDTDCQEIGNGSWTKPKWRYCDDPAPIFGGNPCQPGDGQVIEECFANVTSTTGKPEATTDNPDEEFCVLIEEGYAICEPVPGEWSKWSVPDDAECLESNGVYSKTRTRLCDSPPPKFNGNCNGPDSETIICQPVNGGWSEWSVPDDSTCYQDPTGSWIKKKTRQCDNPEPKFGGKCQGDFEDFDTCLPVDGDWEFTGKLGSCTENCWQKRHRSCSNPEPKFGGRSCSGQEFTRQSCNSGQCIGGSCFETKYTGKDLSFSGEVIPLENNDSVKNCQELCQSSEECFRFTYVFGYEDTAICHLEPDLPKSQLKEYPKVQLISGPKFCPEHGNWSDFGLWTLCSRPCNGGLRKRYRQCDNPPPSSGGDFCIGNSTETEECNQFPCPESKYQHCKIRLLVSCVH